MKVLARLLTVAGASLLSGCGNLLFSLVNAPSHFGTFRRHADIAYGADARQKLDVYSPAGTSGRPIVIFWYGGSWKDGDKAHYRFVGAALAGRGFVTVIPDYRLYPDVKFPAFVEDGARAVAWAQQHALEFGGDPGRVVLMGHSAGAHEAALLAFDHRYLQRVGVQPQSIAGLIGLSGPYQLTPNSDLLNSIFTEPYRLADWQPVRYVDQSSPPALLLHGANDRIVSAEHADRLEEALKASGVRVEKTIYPGRNHADTVAAFSSLVRYRLPALARSVEFIEDVTSRRSNSELSRGSPTVVEGQLQAGRR